MFEIQRKENIVPKLFCHALFLCIILRHIAFNIISRFKMADRADVFSPCLVRSIILDRSSVVAAVVNVERVNSDGLWFVP